MTNPFIKAKPKKAGNPFIKASSNGKPNPFAAKAALAKRQRIADYDRMIEEAEQRYEDSLKKAMKAITKEQTKHLFDISDRHMVTLMNLTRQRKRIIEGKELKPKKERKRRKKREAPPRPPLPRPGPKPKAKQQPAKPKPKAKPAKTALKLKPKVKLK